MSVELIEFAGKKFNKKLTIGQTSLFYSKNELVGIEYFGRKRRTFGIGYGLARTLRDEGFENAWRTAGQFQHWKQEILTSLPYNRYNNLSRVERYAGRGAKAFNIIVGNTNLYFSYDKLLAIKYNNTLYYTGERLGGATPRHLGLIKDDNSVEVEDLNMIAREAFHTMYEQERIRWKTNWPPVGED